ncbi:uncharacterized protein LOC123666951 [Melitaea cinxia]|uniref:uncharacterized protein LOC123666951 n=1 Tax=Melitaea cinxia TaxID=113334 RepID=UPI001E272FE0|nr:uncharacterized protein LOC123666951 [Melitaea cinxia]
MLKITTILVLMCIGTLSAGGKSCNSCGPECAPACGTRYFRTCCFNYLRRKRGPDMTQIPPKDLLHLIPENKQLAEEYEIWESSPSDYELYDKIYKVDNTLHNVFA